MFLKSKIKKSESLSGPSGSPPSDSSPSSSIVRKNAGHLVFGQSLESVLEEENQGIVYEGDQTDQLVVPLIVKQTITWLEKNALEEEGLFRISGHIAQVERLKALYNTDVTGRREIDLDKEQVNPHMVAGLLKLWFRELPQPILLERFYTTFLKVQKNSDPDVRMKNLRLMVQKLPKGHNQLLLYLCRFLKKVASVSNKNKMTVENLSTCWYPNLLRKQDSTMEELVLDADYCKSLVGTLIQEVEFLSVTKQPLLEKALSREASFSSYPIRSSSSSASSSTRDDSSSTTSPLSNSSEVDDLEIHDCEFQY